MSEASDAPAGDRAIVAANGLSDDIGVSATDRLPSVTPAGSVGVVDAEVVAAIGQFQVDQRGCPHCRGREIVRWGQSDAMPRYRCKSCRRTFNALTKTPLAHLRMKDKWGTQAQALIDGVTIVAAAKRCGVDYKTAFRWRHRFLKSLAGDKPLALSGIVESDETFILESFKGKRSGLPRKARKRGG
jgi:transposase-like protein